jgi:hypothetical protein
MRYILSLLLRDLWEILEGLGFLVWFLFSALGLVLRDLLFKRRDD